MKTIFIIITYLIVCFNSFSQISTKRYSNGDKYVGEFKNGKMDGFGTYTYADGSKYVGNWKANKVEGHGTYTSSDGGKYVGGFKNDVKSGYGTFIHPNGAKYVGNWKNNKRDGYGTFIYSNGEKYVGNWRNNEKEGHGTYTYLNGSRYVGEFLLGEKFGKGQLYPYTPSSKNNSFKSKKEIPISIKNKVTKSNEIYKRGIPINIKNKIKEKASHIAYKYQRSINPNTGRNSKAVIYDELKQQGDLVTGKFQFTWKGAATQLDDFVGNINIYKITGLLKYNTRNNTFYYKKLSESANISHVLSDDNAMLGILAIGAAIAVTNSSSSGESSNSSYSNYSSSSSSCLGCNGSGWKKCFWCDGDGYRWSGFGFQEENKKTCAYCNGSKFQQCEYSH